MRGQGEGVPTPNFKGEPCPELAEASGPLWALVRENTKQKGRGTPGRQEHEQRLQPRPKPIAPLMSRQAMVRQGTLLS
ncbi:hypothetical protein NDU88_011084 [Pleurodeles waltl]|uniref:Uncharacterized protein n=1 Tax=Pleurodeles waltl TaxID=8319 RepID=A0AAV7S1H6_PLEWA|nr:hypothetical protein NDU88_011084 [Pleurodeles waltl]